MEEPTGAVTGTGNEKTIDSAPHKNIATEHDAFSAFQEHASFNVGMALVWLAAVLAMSMTMFFWWMNRTQAGLLEDRKSEKEAIVQQLNSPNNKDIEQRANAFKDSVTELKKAYGAKYSYGTFINSLYTKLTKDVKINNFSIGADETVTINGTTSSYRAVADLAVALKSWENLSSVELLSTSNSGEEGKAIETVFSISAKINKAKESKTASSSAAVNTSSSTSTGQVSTEGGQNAQE